jgi:hypothetical protein
MHKRHNDPQQSTIRQSYTHLTHKQHNDPQQSTIRQSYTHLTHKQHNDPRQSTIRQSRTLAGAACAVLAKPRAIDRRAQGFSGSRPETPAHTHDRAPGRTGEPADHLRPWAPARRTPRGCAPSGRAAREKRLGQMLSAEV